MRSTTSYQLYRILLFSMGVLYPVFITAGALYSLPMTAFYGLTVLVYAYVFYRMVESREIRNRPRVINIMAFLVAIAIFNSMISLNRNDTIQKWIIWLITMLLLLMLNGSITKEQRDKLFQLIPDILFISTAIAVILTIQDFGRPSIRNQGIGLYAGALLITSFYKSGIRRTIYMVAGLVFIYGSSSRAALLGAVVGLIPVILFFLRKRGFLLVGLIGATIILVNLNSVIDVMNEFLNRKALITGDPVESLFNSYGQREELMKIGLVLVDAKPLTGYGMGDGYKDLVYLGEDTKTVHNGFLTTIIEIGIPMAAVFFIGILTSIVNVFRSTSLHADYRVITASFFLYFLVRAWTENYLIFNSANIYSLISLTLLSLFLFPIKKDPDPIEEEA